MMSDKDRMTRSKRTQLVRSADFSWRRVTMKSRDHAQRCNKNRTKVTRYNLVTLNRTNLLVYVFYMSVVMFVEISVGCWQRCTSKCIECTYCIQKEITKTDRRCVKKKIQVDTQVKDSCKEEF